MLSGRRETQSLDVVYIASVGNEWTPIWLASEGSTQQKAISTRGAERWKQVPALRRDRRDLLWVNSMGQHPLCDEAQWRVG